MCPVCGDKLRNSKIAGSLFFIVGTHDNYTERLCNGTNHTLQIFVNERTNFIVLVRVSLDSKYSRFISLDYLNQKSTIICYKNSVPEAINIAKLLIPDFPDLRKLKEKVGLYVVLS